MGLINTFLLHLYVTIAVSLRRGDRDDRGDVPGWVLVTLMSVTLVTAIVVAAKPQLVGMLQASLNSVK